MKIKTINFLSGLAFLAVAFASCSKPAPTAEIFATIDQYTVTFNPTVTNADTYSWDFGDGSAESTEKNPVHTYESFGDYTVVLVVTGEGGEYTTTKTITIEATSIRDLLTGGSQATSGKTWVLDRAYTAGDGGGPVMNPPYTIMIPSAENVLDMFGLGAEYDNEFTFFFDGKYSVNAKNGNVLAAAVYGYLSSTIVGDPAWAVGLCTASWSAPASATWTHHTTDLVVENLLDPNDTNVPPATTTTTITGQDWISLSTGSYFGILDFPSTLQFVVDEITTNKMRVSLFVCGYSDNGGDPKYNMMPSNMFHLSFVKK
jgi:PKD repeat protein